MQSGDQHEYINASDLLVHPVTERTSDIRGNIGSLGNVGTGQPGTEALFASPTRPSSGPAQQPSAAFGVSASSPPTTDLQTMMQRGDEVNAIQRMLTENQTSAVTLIGTPGVGKSTLAALLYQRLFLAKQRGMPSPTHMVWLTLNSYTTLPDLIEAILNGINMHEPGLFQLKVDQQISTLLRALRRSQENAFIVLDQFETLLRPEVTQGVAGRGNLPAFLKMLQTDLSTSRFLLTSYDSLYSDDQADDTRVRSYLLTRISLPEGIALLQQRQVQGTPEQLSLAWQRCTGNVFSLVLLSTLIQASKITLQTFLDEPDYKAMWTSDVITNLIEGIYYYLTLLQRATLQVLSLFTTPAPLEGIIMTITGATIANQRSHSQASATFEQELTQLAQVGLVQRLHNTQGKVCYTLHSLLRNYILEHFLDDEPKQLSPSHTSTTNDDITSAQKAQNAEALKNALATGHVQVANYYKDAIQERCPPRDQRTGPLDVELVIGAIRHLCLSWRWQQACDLLFHEHLQESLITWGNWNTLLGLYIELLPPTGVLARKDEGIVASHIAMIYGRIGEYQQSKNYFEQALKIQREVEDHQGEAITLTNQGEIMRIRGDYDQARINFERAMALEQEPDNNLRCAILHNMGLISQFDHNYEQAIQCYTESLRLAAGLGKQEYTGMILTNLGMALYENHEYREGLSLLLTALQVREIAGDPSLSLLERFLVALEQNMGHDSYVQFCQEAAAIQSEVLARFTSSDMRQ
jgi:tetratricopeptide (TPR) repeat protein